MCFQSSRLASIVSPRIIKAAYREGPGAKLDFSENDRKLQKTSEKVKDESFCADNSFTGNLSESQFKEKLFIEDLRYVKIINVTFCVRLSRVCVTRRVLKIRFKSGNL